ncbi:MAG: hypothetical protein FJZ56_06075 [Chlamydiae bacterium]|nr:hypothetical protein [Chlamydiota bacterium]
MVNSLSNIRGNCWTNLDNAKATLEEKKSKAWVSRYVIVENTSAKNYKVMGLFQYYRSLIWNCCSGNRQLYQEKAAEEITHSSKESEAIIAKYRPSTPDTIRCDNDERIHTEDQCLLDENQKKALEYFSTSHPCAALKFVSLTHEIKVPPKSGKLTSYITIGMCNEKGCYNATNQHRFPIIVNLFFYDPDFQNFTEFKKPTLTSSSFETNFEDIELPMNFF